MQYQNGSDASCAFKPTLEWCVSVGNRGQTQIKAPTNAEEAWTQTQLAKRKRKQLVNRGSCIVCADASEASWICFSPSLKIYTHTSCRKPAVWLFSAGTPTWFEPVHRAAGTAGSSLLSTATHRRRPHRWEPLELDLPLQLLIEVKIRQDGCINIAMHRSKRENKTGVIIDTFN